MRSPAWRGGGGFGSGEEEEWDQMRRYVQQKPFQWSLEATWKKQKNFNYQCPVHREGFPLLKIICDLYNTVVQPDPGSCTQGGGEVPFQASSNHEPNGYCGMKRGFLLAD